MKLIDLHCDTLTNVMEHPEAGNLRENRLSVDLQRLGAHERALQFFACFVYLDAFENRDPDQAFAHTCKVFDYFQENMNKNQDLAMPVLTAADASACLQGKASRIGAMLTVEEGGMIGGKMERLEYMFERGVRLLTLTWNFANCLAHPNSVDADKMQLGLTDFGFDVIERMQQLGMIVDVSHLSDGGFYDVARIMKKPFIASHSNARTLCPHPRNLTDEMLKLLAQKGGVTGLNLCPAFLDVKAGSTIAAMVRHIKHIINVAGEDVMAIGTDFDGIGGPLEIEGTQHLDQLLDALKRNGLPERVLDKIFWENAYRVIQEVLPA